MERRSEKRTGKIKGEMDLLLQEVVGENTQREGEVKSKVDAKDGVEVERENDHADSDARGPLILLWNRYQETGSHLWPRIFHRVGGWGIQHATMLR